MKATERRDAIALLLVAGALLAGLIATQIGGWLDAVVELARSPLVPVLAGVALAGLVALLLVRAIATRRALARRVGVAMIPADSFAPDPEAVTRFAAGLSRTRRLSDLLRWRATTVRVRIDTDPAGLLRYGVELPDHARAALRTAAAGYDAVELHDLDPPPADHDDEGGEERVEVARAELVLARPSAWPLRDAGIDPDPLAAFARTLETLRVDDERAVVCVDLLPISPGRRRRIRRRLLRAADRAHHDHRRALGGLLEPEQPAGRQTVPELIERRAGHRALASKLGSPEPLFEIQVLLRVTSPTRGRAVAQLHALLGAFDSFAGENHFRVSGLRLPGGFLGADAPWRRRRFDRRARTGLFKPARRRIVTASEIAGLLKPPTASCGATGVLRSGGVIPQPPRDLPTFTGQPGLLPLGRVRDAVNGERVVGVPLEGTFFTYMAGRSRYGKTETGIGQFVHLARTGHGCFFLDPHEDAIERIKHYLTDAERDRIVELDFADHRAGRQPGWNLFAAGERPRHQQVDAIVDAFASALRWDEVNARALNLTTQSAQALTDLADALPAELAPTIFQIPTLLTDAEWRAAVLPKVAPATRQFFTERFPLLSSEAITPVTNLIDRLRAAPAVAAVLGNPTSQYDVRAAMDSGAIVLACPGSGATRDKLVANFLVYDLLHAAKSRATLDPERRRPFFVFLDEVQTYDGASSGNLAALLEQTAKYGIRAFLFNQNPERLTPATLNAVTTNRSHLLSTTLNASGAGIIGREWEGQIDRELLTRLERYTFLASITHHGRATPPFLVHGLPADDLYDRQPGEAAPPREDGAASAAKTIAALDRHDARILAALGRGRRDEDEPPAERTV
ncbi:MAG TPA: hypothetical protein VLK58_09195, partial [Conexibacter sp.]|nr:hypothetical protein [Conexibacter sp.]